MITDLKKEDGIIAAVQHWVGTGHFAEEDEKTNEKYKRTKIITKPWSHVSNSYNLCY